MARIVVIASTEVGRDLLADVVEPDDELVVLVPAVEQSRLAWLANDEGDARRRAREVGREVGRDAPADAALIEVKPDPPSQLVADAVGAYQPDRIVLALREGDEAAWLEQGELDAIPDAVDGVPVVRVSL